MFNQQRKWFLLVLIATIVFQFMSSAFHAEAAEHRSVGSASELQAAFEDDECTDITITSSLTGNFVIPKWVSSIKGSSKNVTITPANLNLYTLQADSGVFGIGESSSLTIGDLTIICGEENSNCIYLGSVSREILLDNVVLKANDINSKGCGINLSPLSKITLRNCSFYNLTWGIYARSDFRYDVVIERCYFDNVYQAFAAYEPKGKVKIYNSEKTSSLSYWVFIHGKATIEVTVDQTSINAAPEAGFFHRYLDKQESARQQESSELSKYAGDFDDRNNKFRESHFYDEQYTSELMERGVLIRSDYETSLLALNKEFGAELGGLDFNDSDLTDEMLKSKIKRVATLYFHLAKCLTSDGYSGWDFALRHFVSDENLRKAIIDKTFSAIQLAMLGLSSPSIVWGNLGNMRDVFTNMKIANADSIFRDNLHLFRDWLEVLDKTEKEIEVLMGKVNNHKGFDISYIRDLNNAFREIYDFKITAFRLARIRLFDIPIQTVFTVSYSKTANVVTENTEGWLTDSVSDRGKDLVIQIARETAPFYSISQQLCVLNNTNDLRQELLSEWKEALTIESDEEMKTYLATDADIMRETERVQQFYTGWR